MVFFPNAKINLGLNVIQKREDGFHDIETVLLPVAIHDILEIVPSGSGKTVLETSGLKLPGNEAENLCLRAFHLLENELKIPPVLIHLHKVIPMGAGLGGGSSDAASTLILLNDLFTLGLTAIQMQGYARCIGSDCAFFIDNKTSFATGRGDMLEPLDINLEGHFIILVIPPVHCNTAEGYRNIQPAKPAKNILSIVKSTPAGWKNLLQNDFETTVFAIHPEIRKIKEQLYSAGAVYASMSGSGSAVYGIFDNEITDSGLFREYAVWKGIL